MSVTDVTCTASEQQKLASYVRGCAIGYAKRGSLFLAFRGETGRRGQIYCRANTTPGCSILS